MKILKCAALLTYIDWTYRIYRKVDELALKKITIKCKDVDDKEYGSHVFESASIHENRKKKTWIQLISPPDSPYSVKLHLSAIMLHSRVNTIQ